MPDVDAILEKVDKGEASEPSEEESDETAKSEDEGERSEPEPESEPEKAERSEGERSEPEPPMTEREKANYWEMKKERKARQEAEKERDLLRFKELKREAETETAEEEEEPGDDDFLNKQQVEKRVNKALQAQEELHRKQMTRIWTREGAQLHEDFDKVLSLGEDLVRSNPGYQAQIAEAYRSGDNPALVVYELIRQDKSFAALAKEAGLDSPVSEPEKPAPEKADKQALEAAKKAKENAAKPRTTGNQGGGEGGGADEELTMEYVSSLSDAQFAALPVSKRNAILAKFGA
jgi:hypothetical protein